MRRNLRLLGFAIVVTTLLMLGVDLLKHASDVDGVSAKAAPSPAGFEHDLSGTGTITTAFSGRVTMIAEDVAPNDEGGSESIPRYRVEGDDPTPEQNGMLLTQSVIVSAPKAENAFRVDAPEAWLPVDKNSSTLRFDFQQLWRLSKPVFFINSFGENSTLKIKSSVAKLDPKTNLVMADGFFTLDTGDLHLEGQSLTYDPSTARMDFTPYHGLLRWSIRAANGQVIQGDCDGPGFFQDLRNGEFLLQLNSETSVRTHFPPGNSIAGNIETPQLSLKLSQNSDGNWVPRIATLAQPTLWHGDSIQLRGADSTIGWGSDGYMSDILINGAVTIIPNNGAFIKTTAKDYAQLFANEDSVHLAGDVTIHRPDGSVKGRRAVFNEDLLTISGAVSVIGEQGTAVADAFTTDSDNNWALSGHAYLEPADEQISWLSADKLSLNNNGDIDASGNLSAQLIVAGKDAELACDTFSSQPQDHFSAGKGLWRANNANGNVVLKTRDGVVSGDSLKQLGPNRFKVSSNNGAVSHGEINDGVRNVKFSSEEIYYSEEMVSFEGSPQINVPVAELGLLRDVAILSARKIEYVLGSKSWRANENVLLQGAVEGYGQYVLIEPERFVIQGGALRGETLCSVSTVFEDKTQLVVEGEKMELTADNSIAINGDAYVKRQLGDIIEWLRCDDILASKTNGSAKGQVRAIIDGCSASASALNWQRKPESDVFRFAGDSLLSHPQAEVSGSVIEFSPGLSTIVALSDEENSASIKRASGQSATGAWIKYNYLNQSLDARRATFEDNR